MTSMLDKEYNDSVLIESLVEDIREFTDGMEASEGKGGGIQHKKSARQHKAQSFIEGRPEGTLS